MTLKSLTDGSIIFSYKLTAIINTWDKVIIHRGNTFINHLINVFGNDFFSEKVTVIIEWWQPSYHREEQQRIRKQDSEE